MSEEKLDPADFYELKYWTAEMAILQEQMANIDITGTLLQERRQNVGRSITETKTKLDEIVAKLEQRYGVNIQQVDWKTGEIKTEAPSGPTIPAEAGGGRDGRLDEASGPGI